MEEPRAPFSPPCRTSDLPGTSGHIGPALEDFRVDEVPLYAASGEGEHLYVRIEKRGLTTRDAIGRVAEASSVPAAEIGSAGMKDKNAVTTQWLSVPARRARPAETWALPEGLRVLEVTRHGNKLRTGHLKGNRFQIRIEGATDDALERALGIVSALSTRGLANYFGAQRFGHGGRNLEKGLRWLSALARGDRGPRMPHFEQKLLSSVVQSEVFNRYVALRLAEGLDGPLEGEVVRLEGTGSHFAVEDPSRELPRWAARDIHPTGPMIGPKGRAATGRALALEEQAAGAIGLAADARDALRRFAEGTRRDLLVWPADMSILPSGPGSLTASFYLPAGSYATELVRELTRTHFLDGARDPSGA